MKNRFGKYQTYIILFVLVFLWFLFMGQPSGDDVWFVDAGSSMSLKEFVIFRYNKWTTRLVIEAIMIVLLKLPNVVWITLTALMVVLLYYGVQYLLQVKNSFETYISMIFIIIFVCFSPFSEAGWYATTINYLWPVATFFYGVTLFKDVIDNKKIGMKKTVFCVVAIFFSSNQEQISALLFGYFILSLIAYIWKYKRFPRELAACGVVICAMLIFHMTGPGNANRTLSEINTWYPDYVGFNVVDKLILGIVSTISGIVCGGNIIILICSLAITIMVVIKGKCNFMGKIVSCIPPLMVVIGQAFCEDNISGPINEICCSVKMFSCTVVQSDLYSEDASITLIIGTIYFLIYMYSLWIIFSKKAFFPFVVLASMLCSRIMMGFSPTVFASGERTFVFMYIGMLFLTLKSIFQIVCSNDFLKNRN